MIPQLLNFSDKLLFCLSYEHSFSLISFFVGQESLSSSVFMMLFLFLCFILFFSLNLRFYILVTIIIILMINITAMILEIIPINISNEIFLSVVFLIIMLVLSISVPEISK